MHGLEDQHIRKIGRMGTDYKLPNRAVRLFSWPSSCSFFLQQVSLCICSDLCFASPIQCPTYSLRKTSKKIILVFYDLEVYIQLQFYSWSH